MAQYIIISDPDATLYYSSEGGVTTTFNYAHVYDDFAQAEKRQQELAAHRFYDFDTWTVRAFRAPRYNCNRNDRQETE